ncbi:MAG: glycosyltransferase family 2 protein [Propionibacteriaceae bacterium]|nr:glycosyltransferase family 2 protein [Propionibacteriaceae bacterium]
MADCEKPPRTLIIVPAWNEAAVIGETLDELHSHQPDIDVLVVDDGSRDDTAAIARRAGATVVSLPFNLGVGGALRTGFEYAHRNGYDQVLQFDADGQHDPKDIPRILEALSHADIAIGARFAGTGSYSAGFSRRLMMGLLAGTVSRIARTRLTDVTSGFRAGNRRAIQQYRVHFPVEYLADTVDSLVMALRSGLTVTQIPVEMRQRQAGQPSTSPVKSAVYLGRSLLALLIAVTRPKIAVKE